MDLYTDILIESFLSTCWPMAMEITSYAMRAFGGYNMEFAAALSVLGSILAVMLLWFFGRLIHIGIQKTPLKLQDEKYQAMQVSMRKFCIWLFIVVWLPWGFMVAILGGYFKVPLKITMPLALLGLTVYYVTQFIYA